MRLKAQRADYEILIGKGTLARLGATVSRALPLKRAALSSSRIPKFLIFMEALLLRAWPRVALMSLTG